jgi:putative ABC transport system permease protein
MLYNYLKVILRNFISDGMYTFIIIFGLAIGLAASLIIAQYVHFELSFDKQYKDRDRIFYTYMKWKNSGGDGDGLCQPAIAPLINRSIPEAESSVRIIPFFYNKGDEFILRREENGKTVFYTRVAQAYQVDKGFLDFFSIPMVEGNRKDVWDNPFNIVITRRLAEKFFGKESALNKMLRFSYQGFPVEVKVTGVTENPLPNSSIQFDLLAAPFGEGFDNMWNWGIFQTFVKLHRGADPATVEKKINAVAAAPLMDADKEGGGTSSIHLFPFENFHFYKPYNSNGVSTVQFTGDRRMISFFITLGIIILIISWVNYINLTTARALRRAKEVGLRKVNGASRKNIILQFLMEFFSLNVVSLLLALTITQLCFGTFARSIGSNADWILWKELSFWIIGAGFLICSTLASGLYPAFVMSNYSPAKVLKGVYSRSQGGISIRRGLVMAQVGLSVFLLMSIYVIAHQLNYMQTKNLGMSSEQVLVIRLDELDTAFTRYRAFDRFKIKVSNIKDVQRLGAADVYPGQKGNGIQGYFRKHSPEKMVGFQVHATFGEYLETMSMQLLEGRTFSSYSAEDSTKVILTESAARDLEFDPPALAIGQEIVMNRLEGDRYYEVIGIIKDFSTSMKEPGQGTVIHHRDIYPITHINYFSLKLSTQNLASTMNEIQREWSNLFNNAPFDYFFLDTYFDTFYKEERQFAGVFGFFSIIAVIITSMGLFGLSLFDTGSRTKEVGIRKSLGGSPSGIMWLFSKEYLKLICIASVVSIPAGIWILGDWLKNYPRRIDLGVDIIVVPVVLMILIAVITIGYQTFKAAHMNPVNSLKVD